MSAPIFEPQPGSRRPYDVCARLGGDVTLHIAGACVLDEIELVRSDAGTYLSFRVTGAQARAMAAELLACADACDAAMGRA